MGGQKLLWVLLGLSLISMIASANRVKSYDDVIEEEDFEDDEDDDCDPRCEKDCRQHEANCKSGVVRDACGCCECAQSEGGSPPKVASVPLHAKNVTGGSAALSCEVTGDPIPFISWMKTNVNNETFELPGSDKNIMTLTRGGPEKHEATAWIQIMNLKKVHEGDYSCVASNKHGKATATARLKVISKKKWRRHHKNE